MPARQSADTPPDARAGRASPQQRGRRRPAVRWIAHGVLFVALAVGIFGVLPRLGGLTRDAAGLRHARPAFLAAAIVAQAASLGCYALLYRQVLGSATGTLVNVNALEAEGIDAATTGEAIGLTSLVSTVALIVLFGIGFVATAGRHVSHTYLTIAGIALGLVVAVLAAVLVIGAHPEIAGHAGRWAASIARHVKPGIDPEKVAETSSRLASLARSALTGRAFLASSAFASADLLLDLLSLDLVFLALRYQPGFGPLAVAYAAANIASLRGGEHRQRHPGDPRRAGRHRGHAGGHHRRLRRAAAHGGAGRTRLPDRELLAPADPRRRRLSQA